jgi:hypothetical protein
MKAVVLVLTLGLACCIAPATESITIQHARGDVSVRHGVAEVWNNVVPGDVLRPNDTMRTGKGGNVVLLVRWGTMASSKRMVLPAQVIVDMSDIRDLTQEELMLKLTMEKVRSSSYQWKNDGMTIPDAAVVHGANETIAAPLSENDIQTGQLQLNGVRVLYENGLFASCVLRAMEVFRLYPALSSSFEHRLMLAEAMEKANLRGEALAEYGFVSRLEGLTESQHQQVQGKIQTLRK